MMTLDEALHYIHAVCWKGSIPGLERISALLGAMGHPERKCKFVHVAGTNGKGSTCAMLASIFQAAGYKTGLYTSPFIVEFGERIQVNGQMISNDDICALTEYVKPFAESIFEQPTEFEMVTAIGFEYFARQQCDIVVCEVGMGGEFDATNVILPPEAAILCNIGLDHTEFLGDTLEKIAATKSGIIKPGCDAVIYREQPSVEAVFEERCKKVGAKLHKANFDSIRLRSHGLEGQVFDCDGYEALELPLLGDHQLHNAAVVLTAVDALRTRGWKLPEEAVRKGLKDVKWPGRFELLRKDPLFIIDGGHNPQCIEAAPHGAHRRPRRQGFPLHVCQRRAVRQRIHHGHAGQSPRAGREGSGKVPRHVRQARHALRDGRGRREAGGGARGQGRRRPLLRLALHARRHQGRCCGALMRLYNINAPHPFGCGAVCYSDLADSG